MDNGDVGYGRAVLVAEGHEIFFDIKRSETPNLITGERTKLREVEAEKWPPMTSDLIDWGTKQGLDMDSPSIRRIENGQSPEWTAEELRQIREQKRLEKTVMTNCPGNSSPDEIKRNLPKGKQVKKDSTED
ncbi:hypothetical protein GcC1_013048 [Golovinomyces cichoracearum]|uniref:Uncharacterized protein n=1 Tax=Golovinomyces cichoracearum TaxID=62708 RepID=A0A420J6Z7_9PEZI|nr:hypothetical protein GcC1_013048 [Golovinomyces cichoracearum]